MTTSRALGYLAAATLVLAMLFIVVVQLTQIRDIEDGRMRAGVVCGRSECGVVVESLDQWVEPEFVAKKVVVQFEFVPIEELGDEWGWAWVEPPDENGRVVCTITTAGPRLVDDVWSDTIGHEVLHCLYGDYHHE